MIIALTAEQDALDAKLGSSRVEGEAEVRHSITRVSHFSSFN
jgi:hypothetical protein